MAATGLKYSLALEHLALFLAEEVRYGDELKWFKELDFGRICYNQSCIRIDDKESNFFYIYSQDFADIFPEFKIERNRLQAIINAWVKIYDLLPETIELTQKGNKFTFEFVTKYGLQKIVVE